VEALADGPTLHPVQQALVDCAGSQCGYCTPGFVMSLFAGYYTGELDDHTTEGNLCRCTGYAPIRRATAQLRDQSGGTDRFAQALQQPRMSPPGIALETALSLKGDYPQAAWIAGGTDLGVDLSHGKPVAPAFICLDRITELKNIEVEDATLRIGAGASLSTLETHLTGLIPALDQMLLWFAARQVKNRATLGGNLGSASPIGDLLPLLLALDARIELRSLRGARSIGAADYFIAYRKTLRAEDELVTSVVIPRTAYRNAAYKVAKRQTDDISIVAAVFALGLDTQHCVQHIRLAYGGVAAIPMRATKTEQFLQGRLLDNETMEHCRLLLRDEFTPLSDHRADATYRRELCASLFAKFVAEHVA
jgi:xanthine dehydrogenase small subunit